MCSPALIIPYGKSPGVNFVMFLCCISANAVGVPTPTPAAARIAIIAIAGIIPFEPFIGILLYISSFK